MVRATFKAHWFRSKLHIILPLVHEVNFMLLHSLCSQKIASNFIPSSQRKLHVSLHPSCEVKFMCLTPCSEGKFNLILPAVIEVTFTIVNKK